MSQETIAAWESIKPFAIHGLTVMITAFATYLFTARHFRKQKCHEFLQRRLDELYGPLFGLIKQVGATGKRVYIVSHEDDNRLSPFPPNGCCCILARHLKTPIYATPSRDGGRPVVT